MERQQRILKGLGERIKQYRKARELTQVRFAAQLDIDERHLRRIESGKMFPSLQLLIAISKELGLTLAELFEENNEKKRSSFPALVGQWEGLERIIVLKKILKCSPLTGSKLKRRIFTNSSINPKIQTSGSTVLS